MSLSCMLYKVLNVCALHRWILHLQLCWIMLPPCEF